LWHAVAACGKLHRMQQRSFGKRSSIVSTLHCCCPSVLCCTQVLRAGEAAAAELARQQHEQQQLAAGGGVGQELAVSCVLYELRVAPSTADKATNRVSKSATKQQQQP
jgi:hypothetical protein